jgi:hypothetical protein
MRDSHHSHGNRLKMPKIMGMGMPFLISIPIHVKSVHGYVSIILCTAKHL